MVPEKGYLPSARASTQTASSAVNLDMHRGAGIRSGQTAGAGARRRSAGFGSAACAGGCQQVARLRRDCGGVISSAAERRWATAGRRRRGLCWGCAAAWRWASERRSWTALCRWRLACAVTAGCAATRRRPRAHQHRDHYQGQRGQRRRPVETPAPPTRLPFLDAGHAESTGRERHAPGQELRLRRAVRPPAAPAAYSSSSRPRGARTAAQSSWRTHRRGACRTFVFDRLQKARTRSSGRARSAPSSRLRFRRSRRKALANGSHTRGLPRPLSLIILTGYSLDGKQ